MVAKQEKSLKRNAFYNVLKTVLNVVFPLITFPYASRILLPEGIGKVNFASTVVNYFALLGCLGIPVYGSREAAKVRDDSTLFTKLVKEIWAINITATFFSYILFFIAIFGLPRFNEYRNLLCIYSTTILFTTLGIEWIYSAVEEYKYIAIRSFIFQIISIVLLFVFVKTSDDTLKYALIVIISSFGSNICNFIHARKYLDLKVKVKLEIKKHLKPVFIIFTKSIAVSVYTMLDVAMLGFMTNDTEVGLYTSANKIVHVVLSLIVAATAVFMPRLSYYAEQDRDKKFNNLLRKCWNYMLCFAIPASLGLFLIADPLLLIFSGEKFLGSVIIMKIMSPLLCILALSNFTGIQIFIPLRKEVNILYATIIGAVINFTVNLILIPIYGAQGAALSSVIAESIVTISQLFMARKYFCYKDNIKPVIQYIFGTLLFSIPVILICNFVNSIILKIILSIISASIIYIAFLGIVKNQVFLEVINLIKNKKRNEA